MPHTDATAVALAREGDSDAFRALVDRHSRAVFRLAHRMTGSPQDAEDVVQETFLALSQLPKDEGIPLLIKVAKTNQNPAVRKQAMFWLGQSKDPRALEFFAEVLSK